MSNHEDHEDHEDSEKQKALVRRDERQLMPPWHGMRLPSPLPPRRRAS